MGKKELLKQRISTFFESKYFLILISILTIFNYMFKVGMWTYIEVGIILIVMMITNSKYVYMPSIVIFILGGGLSKVPNFKSFSFIFACVIGGLLIITLIYKVIINYKKLFSITVSNSFIISTIILLLSMMLSLITSINKITTLAAIGGFSVNLVVMYFVLSSITVSNDTKYKLADSFVAIFYVIFSMVLMRFFKLLSEYSIKTFIFDKTYFHLGWDYSNHYCSMLILSFIFSVYILITKWHDLSWHQRILYIFPVPSIVITCIFVSARGPIYGLFGAICCGFILFVTKYRKNKNILIPSCISVITIGIIFVFIYIFVLKDVFGNKGLNGRPELWNLAIKHFKEHMFFGTGYGTQTIFIRNETLQGVYNYHNYYLQITTCGIVGIIAFTIYLLNICWHCINKLDWFNIAFISIFALFLVNGFVDTLFFSNKIMPLFSICLCYVDLKPKEISLQSKWQKRLNIDTL